MNYTKTILLIVTSLLLVSCTDDESRYRDVRISELESELSEVKFTLEKTTELNDDMKLQIDIANEKLRQENQDLNVEIIKHKDEVSDYKAQLEKLQKRLISESSKGIKIIRYSDNQLYYVYDDKYGNPINVIGYNLDDLAEPENFDVIDMSVKNGAVLNITVTGSLYDFRLIELGWDSDAQVTYEKEIIYSSDEVRNTDIIFNSPLYEGMNSNIVKWKDSSNIEHFFYINFDGYGFSGKIIIAN